MTPLHQLAIFAVSAAVFLALGLLAVGGVAFALACIGTEDQDELRPVTVTMAWLRRVRDRIGRALSGEDDLAEDGTPCPNCGRNTFDRYEVRCWACGWDGSPLPGEYEEEEDDGRVARPLVQGRDERPPESEAEGSGGQEPAHPAGTPSQEPGDVTLSDFDTDTLRIFREANEEHLVPTNEPEPPATGHAANPPAADGGETPAGESTAGDASGAVDDDTPAPEATQDVPRSGSVCEPTAQGQLAGPGHPCCIRCERIDPAEPCQGCYCHDEYPEDPPGPASATMPEAGHGLSGIVPGPGPGVHPDGLGELIEMTVTDPPGPAGPPVTPRTPDWSHGGGTGEGDATSAIAGPGVRRWVAEFLAADDADVDAEWLGWMAARLRAVTA